MSGTPVVIVRSFQPSQQIFKMNFSSPAVDEEMEIKKFTKHSQGQIGYKMHKTNPSLFYSKICNPNFYKFMYYICM